MQPGWPTSPSQGPQESITLKGRKGKDLFSWFCFWLVFFFFSPQVLAAVLAVIKGLSRLGVGEFHQQSSLEGFTNVARDALVPKETIGILMGELEPPRGLAEEPCYHCIHQQFPQETGGDTPEAPAAQ